MIVFDKEVRFTDKLSRVFKAGNSIQTAEPRQEMPKTRTGSEVMQGNLNTVQRGIS